MKRKIATSGDGFAGPRALLAKRPVDIDLPAQPHAYVHPSNLPTRGGDRDRGGRVTWSGVPGDGARGRDLLGEVSRLVSRQGQVGEERGFGVGWGGDVTHTKGKGTRFLTNPELVNIPETGGFNRRNRCPRVRDDLPAPKPNSSPTSPPSRAVFRNREGQVRCGTAG